MAKKSRDKGTRIEREIVHLHRGQGIPAARVPLSGAAGGDFAGDLHILDLRAEVKARAAGEGFKRLELWLGDHNMLFLRRDRRRPLVLLEWETYTQMIKTYALVRALMPGQSGHEGEGGRVSPSHTAPAQSSPPEQDAHAGKRYRCYACGDRLPASAFRADPSRGTGVASRCKDCDQKVRKARLRRQKLVKSGLLSKEEARLRAPSLHAVNGSGG